ncbi:MAG: hypothetical protein OP8BY_0215 [Candidatus Saccharicenans subterraneus]|uniref:Uncharacterized protein n=1 Tax=Candidatus Saccharicenans subterraneus TaxID=2508984 RepID=A0A3E2BLP8_9BACT|nr:MAG: hypothetical protein OP8BY_0215 [Candidatus Saccharicenans subterraneum]
MQTFYIGTPDSFSSGPVGPRTLRLKSLRLKFSFNGWSATLFRLVAKGRVGY